MPQRSRSMSGAPLVEVLLANGPDSLPAPPVAPAAGPFRPTRRALLRGAGAAGASAFLAACGIKGTGAADSATAAVPAGGASESAAAALAQAGSAATARTGGASTAVRTTVGSQSAPATTAATGAADRTDIDKKLNWSNWTTYLDVDAKDKNKHPTLQAFTAKTGIQVTYTEDVNDNTEYFGKIQPQLANGDAISADTFVVTDWMADKIIQLGYALPLDHANIPNLKNLDPALLIVDFDPGRKYSVTWQSGLTGIISNPKSTGGKAVTTIDQLLTDKSLQGRVALLTEMPDTVGLVLLSLGFDPSSFTDDQFNQAIAKVQKAVDSGQIRGFTGNEYTEGIASGDIAACFGWSGDAVQLEADQPGVEFHLPDSGGMRWSDNFLVPVHCKHKKGVEELINFYLDPTNSATVEDYVNYVCPVPAAKAVLAKTDKDVADNDLIFPGDATLAKLHTFMSLDDDQFGRYHKIFDKLSGA